MCIELHHVDIFNILLIFLVSAVLPVQPSMTAGLGTRASYTAIRLEGEEI